MIQKLTIPALLILMLFVIIWLNLGLLHDTLPKISGRETLVNLAAPVAVWRTPEGIPTLRANSTADAFRALGYVHAQDRLWQMELLRRVALGKIAEILGPDYLETNQFLLKWQFAQCGNQIFDGLSISSQQLLQSYCEGINAFIQTHPRHLPFEFSELKFKPEDWQPAHCLAIWRLFGWINSGLAQEILHWDLQQSLSKEHLRLFQLNSATETVPPATRQILQNFSNTYFQQLEIIENLTGLRLYQEHPPDSVRALVYAPRARLTIPNLFYLQNLKTPEFNVWGCCVPGIPLLTAGTNGKVAWTLEPQNGFDTNLIIDNGNFAQLIEKYVYIPISDTDTLVYSFLTRPDQFLVGFSRDSLTEKNKSISLNWTGFQTSDEFVAWPLFFQLVDTDSLPDAFRNFGAPFSRLHLSGPTGHKTEFSLGMQWERARQKPGQTEEVSLIREYRKMSPNLINSDVRILHRILLDRLLENLQSPINAEDARLLQDYLKNWDLEADSASLAATVFNLTMNYLSQNIFLDEMQETLYREFLRFPDLVLSSLVQITRNPNNIWIDNVQTPEHRETLSEMLHLSFNQMLDWLASRNNRSLPASRWGNLTAFHLNPVLSQRNARDWWLVSEKIDWRGRGFPENFLLQTEHDPEKFFSNPLELQFDLADSAVIHWLLSSGQSGHPFSRNYRDQTRRWLAGKPHSEALTTKNTNAFHRLILEPSVRKN